MSTPGDDDFTPPPGSPPPSPPDPFRHPSDGSVERPRFDDSGSGEYAPNYGVTPDPTQQPPPPQPQPQPHAGVHPGHPVHASPEAEPAAHAAPTRAPESRKGMIAPIAAAVVLIGGIGLLIVSSGSDEPETITTPRIAEVGDPDDPLVESTVPTNSVAESTIPEDSIAEPTLPDDSIVEPTLPIQTSPPLVEPTTTPAPEPPDSGGPTQAGLDAALLTLSDIGPGDWTEQIPEFDEFCDTVPDLAEPDARADSVFGAIVTDPGAFGARQISNTLVTYASPEIAEQVFTSDVAEIVACDSTTTTLSGDQYRVEVDSDSFTPEQSEAFPCADQSSFLIIQLVNDDLAVPFIAQSVVSFRCGRNITVTALATTIDLDDLSDDNYFNAAGISNINTGALPGS